jgi:hypothetical protein
MNDRIRELYKEAEKSVIFLSNSNESKQLIIREKFADLIIQECLLALEPNLYESDIEYKVDQAFYKKCERMILKHFGVNN